jgi:hypothetical protein
MTTRAGHEDFSMVTIDDARMNQIASNLILWWAS